MGSFREPPNQQRVRRLKQSSKGDLYQFSLGVPVQSYGSVSAGREKWPFNVLFFLKVEPPCDQT